MKDLGKAKSVKRKHQLRYVLRDLSLALGRLLDRAPERMDIEGWWREIEAKIPKKCLLLLHEEMKRSKVIIKD